MKIYRWMKFRDVMRAVLSAQGVDFALNQQTSAQERQAAHAINAAIEVAWRFHPWSCAVWVAKDLQTLANDAVQPFYEAGFSVLQSYEEDPLTEWQSTGDDTQGKLRISMEYGGEIVHPDDALATPWYLVRQACPQFGVDARSAATAYEQGECVYDASTGEAWRAVLAHTNVALPTAWKEWELGIEYAGGAATKIRRGGVLFVQKAGAVTTARINEPGYGADWLDSWEYTVHSWAPQRVPDFLLRSVVSGARVYMETPDLAAMEQAMRAGLEDAKVDEVRTRKQGLRNAGRNPGF